MLVSIRRVGSSPVSRTTVPLQETIRHARVVELADSLDSGSSVLYGRAGSSPASRTKGKGSRLSRDGTPLHFRWKVRQVHNDAREWWNWQTR